MTENKNRYGAYNNAAQSTSHMHQLLMLYDGAINFLKQAEEAIKEKNFEKRYNLINKVCAIISGLRECLNFEVENDVSEALSEFYLSVDLRLVSIQGSDDLNQLNRVIKELEGMRDAWKDVASQTNTTDKTQQKFEETTEASSNNGSDDISVTV